MQPPVLGCGRHPRTSTLSGRLWVEGTPVTPPPPPLSPPASLASASPSLSTLSSLLPASTLPQSPPLRYRRHHLPAFNPAQDLINAGRVEYYYLPRVTPTTVPLMQVRLYQLCLRHAAPRHSFLAFMDMDEFLVLAPGERAAGGLPALLRGFEASPGLAVNWRLLGSSGHATRQGGGVLRSFTACTPADYVENRQVREGGGGVVVLGPVSVVGPVLDTGRRPARQPPPDAWNRPRLAKPRTPSPAPGQDHREHAVCGGHQHRPASL